MSTVDVLIQGARSQLLEIEVNTFGDKETPATPEDVECALEKAAQIIDKISAVHDRLGLDFDEEAFWEEHAPELAIERTVQQKKEDDEELKAMNDPNAPDPVDTLTRSLKELDLVGSMLHCAASAFDEIGSKQVIEACMKSAAKIKETTTLTRKVLRRISLAKKSRFQVEHLDPASYVGSGGTALGAKKLEIKFGPPRSPDYQVTIESHQNALEFGDGFKSRNFDIVVNPNQLDSNGNEEESRDHDPDALD